MTDYKADYQLIVIGGGCWFWSGTASWAAF